MDTFTSTNSTAGANKLYQTKRVESLGAMGKACNQEPKLIKGGQHPTPIPPPQKKQHKTKRNTTAHKLHTSHLRNLKAGSLRSVEEGEKGNRVYLRNEGF